MKKKVSFTLPVEVADAYRWAARKAGITMEQALVFAVAMSAYAAKEKNGRKNVKGQRQAAGV